MTSSATGFSPPTQSFFRDLGDNLPDGTDDETQSIRRLGGIGIGGASQAEAIPVVAGATATNDILHLSSAAANRGQLFYGSNPLSYYMQRAMTTVANELATIGTITANAHAYTIRLSVSTAEGSNSITKTYTIPVSYHITANIVRVVVPETFLLRAGEGNDFELLMQTNTVTTNLWLRRTSGANVGNYRIRMEILGDGTQTFTENAGVAVNATAYTPINFSTAPVPRAFNAQAAITDAAGNRTFTFPVGLFTAQPIISATLQTAIANPTEVRVTTITAASVTVNVRQFPIITVAANSVLGAPTPLAGATVHMMATTLG